MALKLMADVFQVTGAELLALARAVEHGGAARVEPVAAGVYRVPSASRAGTVHLVTHPVDDDTRLDCDCEAAQRNRPCWHAMAVLLFRLEAAQRDRQRERQRERCRAREREWARRQQQQQPGVAA